MTDQRCEGCGAKVQRNVYWALRVTRCVDGQIRRLCEYCALDEETEKRRRETEEKAVHSCVR